jgi:hypothetical protein
MNASTHQGGTKHQSQKIGKYPYFMLIHMISVLLFFPFILPKKSIFVKSFFVVGKKNQEEK